MNRVSGKNLGKNPGGKSGAGARPYSTMKRGEDGGGNGGFWRAKWCCSGRFNPTNRRLVWGGGEAGGVIARNGQACDRTDVFGKTLTD